MRHIHPNDGSFRKPPNRPNWVSSYAVQTDRYLEPIAVTVSVGEDMSRIRTILSGFARTTIVDFRDNYLHAECRSRVFGFVDDVEFFGDAENSVIHFCSAARSGWSDLGVNRARILTITELLRANAEATSDFGTG